MMLESDDLILEKISTVEDKIDLLTYRLSEQEKLTEIMAESISKQMDLIHAQSGLIDHILIMASNQNKFMKSLIDSYKAG